MPNYQGSPNNLRKEPPKWKHLPTKAIRVPEVFADQLLRSARQLDDNQDTERTPEQIDSLPGLGLGDIERTPEQIDSLPGLRLGDIERTPELAPKSVKQAKVLLTKALKLKANSGGAIKDEIRKALKLLERA